MAKPMTTIQVDVIKSAYRQSKEGFVVSFVIHPQDDHHDLANADIGSQWQMRLVGLDEDGNPKDGAVPAGQFAGSDIASDRVGLSGSAVGFGHAGTGTSGADGSNPSRSTKPVAPDKRLTQRAGILCNDKLFQAWLKETNSAWNIMNLGTAEQKAAELIRVYCGVSTRRDIQPGTQAAELFDQMLNEYTAWQACLEDAS